MLTRRRFTAAVLAGLPVSAALPARAQGWPLKPVRILVPFAAGGNTDSIARLTARQLSELFKEQFIVENRPGANGALAASAAARSPKDGYTLFMAALPQIAIFPAMTKVNYDPVNDFAPVSNVGYNPFVLAASAKLVQAKTLGEFVAYAKAAKDSMPYGSGGIGSLSHLTMMLLLNRAGLTMTHVPYQGGAPAVTDLLAGHIPFYFANLSEVMPHAGTGSLRLLAISSAARAPQLPDVPTVAESGFPGFKTLTWNGLLAPAGTPGEIIDSLAAKVALALKAPELLSAFETFGITPLGDRPDQFRETIAADIKLWAEAVKLAGLSAT